MNNIYSANTSFIYMRVRYGSNDQQFFSEIIKKIAQF